MMAHPGAFTLSQGEGSKWRAYNKPPQNSGGLGFYLWNYALKLTTRRFPSRRRVWRGSSLRRRRAGQAQHRERLSCVESAVGAEVRGGEPGGREEAAMMRRLLWGEGARSCGNSTAWREARESVEGTRRSGAEEPEVCRRSGCRKRSGQRLASCSV